MKNPFGMPFHQNREAGGQDTMLNPRTPFLLVATSLKIVKQEIPISSVITICHGQLANIPGTHDLFVSNKHKIKNFSTFYKSILML